MGLLFRRVQHDAQLLVVWPGEDRAEELCRLRRGRIAEIMHDFARVLDGRLADRYLAHRRGADAREKASLRDDADDRHRAHMFRHVLSGLEMDLGQLPASYGFPSLDGTA